MHSTFLLRGVTDALFAVKVVHSQPPSEAPRRHCARELSRSIVCAGRVRSGV
jgi:hypothetical protein